MRPETTVELTQLVSLLEAPAFAPLRLQLLQPQQFPALQRAVHGLLMLLPQVGQGQRCIVLVHGCWSRLTDRWCSAVHRKEQQLERDLALKPQACFARHAAHDLAAHPTSPVPPLQGDAFRMLQARLAPIPIMAMLSLRDTPAQQQQPSSGSLSAAGSAAALAQSPSQPAGSPAGSPGGSGTWAGLDPAAASPEQEVSFSPRVSSRSQAQRPRLMQLEEKRLVQLFKSRASRLG